MSIKFKKGIVITVERDDVLRFKADVLALKYAQELYGVDLEVVRLFHSIAPFIESELPRPGKAKLIDSRKILGAKSVLFLGVNDLWNFRYQEIRDFGRCVLEQLAQLQPVTEHIAMTIHGANYGLDEIEAFDSEVAGIIDAIENGIYPKNLKRISIVELNERRANKLSMRLNDLLPNSVIEKEESNILPEADISAREKFRSVGYESNNKPHLFVAMPFTDKLYGIHPRDLYDLAIYPTVTSLGYLCERIDDLKFTGDVLSHMKNRIETAELVIAELTTSNPNVFLEIGFAWGCGKQTILLANEEEKLKFDVRGQRCIIYSRIKDLEEKLRRELEEIIR